MSFGKNLTNSFLLPLLATVIGGLIIYWFTTTHAKLEATIHQYPFRMPSAIQGLSASDTVIAAQEVALLKEDTMIYKLYTKLNGNSNSETLQSFLHHPLKVPINRVGEFAKFRKGLCLVSIKNTGNKIIKKVQLVHHSANIYFEYVSPDDKMHTGSTSSKIIVGELAPDEIVDVYLWSILQGEFTLKGVTVVYDDNKIEARQAIEVTGATAWIIQNWVLLVVIATLVLSFLSLLDSLYQFIVRANKN